MKMLTKSASILLLFLLLFAGCGGGGGSSDAASSGTETITADKRSDLITTYRFSIETFPIFVLSDFFRFSGMELEPDTYSCAEGGTYTVTQSDELVFHIQFNECKNGLTYDGLLTLVKNGRLPIKGEFTDLNVLVEGAQIHYNRVNIGTTFRSGVLQSMGIKAEGYNIVSGDFHLQLRNYNYSLQKVGTTNYIDARGETTIVNGSQDQWVGMQTDETLQQEEDSEGPNKGSFHFTGAGGSSMQILFHRDGSVTTVIGSARVDYPDHHSFH